MIRFRNWTDSYIIEVDKMKFIVSLSQLSNTKYGTPRYRAMIIDTMPNPNAGHYLNGVEYIIHGRYLGAYGEAKRLAKYHYAKFYAE